VLLAEPLKPWKDYPLFKSWLSRLEERITKLSGQDYEPAPFSSEQALVAISRLYQLGTRARLGLYKTGVFKQKQLPCFVISIGNIIAGGAGKTPMAVCLAELLISMGHSPAVVSRGYKGQIKKGAGIVGDGKEVFMDAATAGDEPYMMASLKRFPVIVGKNRYDAGRLALDTLSQLNVDVIILDDGFQHMGLARDLNLVLFDHDRPLGNQRFLPAGRLRETPGMSRDRTHGIILTRCPEPNGPGGSVHPLSTTYQGVPVFYTRHQPFIFTVCPDNSDLETLKGRKVLLFSGIARNDSFRDSVEQFKVKVVDHLEFKDHYQYKRADFQRIQKRADAVGADLILTTQKDWVKVDKAFAWEKDLAVVGIRIEFENPGRFKEFIESRLKYNDRD